MSLTSSKVRARACLGVATPVSTSPPAPGAACQKATRSASSCASCSCSESDKEAFDPCEMSYLSSPSEKTSVSNEQARAC